MRDADLMERQIHRKERIELIYPNLRASLRRCKVLLCDRKFFHVEMSGGDDDESKLLHSLARAANGHIFVHLGLATEKELDLVALRQRLCLTDVGIVLRRIPLRRAGYGLVPEMVGKNDGVKSLVLGIFQNTLIILLGIARAGRDLRMNVKIVVKYVLH